MTFSEFAHMLYPYCGEANSPSDFVTVLFGNITEDTDGETFPLLDYEPDYLKRIYNGKRAITPQNASFALSHLDKGKFLDYICAFSFDAIQGIGEALSENGIITDKTDTDVAEKCAGLFAGILAEIAKGKKTVNAPSSNDNNREEKSGVLAVRTTSGVKPIILDMIRRSSARREEMLGENGRFAYLNIHASLFPTARYFPAFIKNDAEGATHRLLDVLSRGGGDILLVGEGGAGKTTSLLYLWNERLEDKNEIPVYIPLSDFTASGEFLKRYIPTNYGFAADTPDCDLLLLLDGYNELSGDPIPLIDELNDLRLARNGRLRVILTSRHEYALSHLPPEFALYRLQHLEVETVTGYLASLGIQAESAPLDVLKTPMMLSLYTQTCVFLKQAETRRDLMGVFDFRENSTRGDIVYNYLLCQAVRLILDRKATGLLVTWTALFEAAPFLAYKMEYRNAFHLSFDDLPSLVYEALSKRLSSGWADALPARLRDYCKRARVSTSPPSIDKLAEDVQSVLLDHQYLLIEEEGKYMFRHQYFRDFLSAVYIAKRVDEALAAEEFVLPAEMSQRSLPAYVISMLGDYYQDGKNAGGYCLQTPLHCLLERFPGSDREKIGYSLFNVLSTWRITRNGVIAGEEIKGLDLRKLPLNGTRFSIAGAATAFYGCDISEATLLNPWHMIAAPRYDGGTAHPECAPAYSPDGQCILTAGQDYGLLEWDLQSQVCRTVFLGHAAPVFCVSYSSDGMYAVSSSADGAIHVWRIGNGECVKKFKITPVAAARSVCFSGNGAYILCGFEDGTIRELNSGSGEYVKVYKGHTSDVHTAVYSADERFVLSASEDKSAREWDRGSGNCVCVYRGHNGAVRNAAYSPDGRHVITLSTDATIREWVRGEKKTIHEYSGYSRGLQSASYSPDGRRFLAVSSGATAIERDRDSGSVQAFRVGTYRAKRAAYNPKLNRLQIIDEGDDIYELDYKTGVVVNKIESAKDSFTEVFYRAGGDFAVVLQGEKKRGEWRVWDLSKDRYSHFIPASAGISGSYILALSKDGKHALMGMKDGIVFEFDITCNKLIHWFEAEAGGDAINCAFYSPDELYIVCGYYGGAWEEWERATGRRTVAFAGSCDIDGNDRRSVAYSHDSSRIAMLCRQGKKTIVMGWSRETGKRVALYESDSRLRMDIQGFSPDGDRLLIYGIGVVVIDMTNRHIKRYAKDYMVENAVFSADGAHIITYEEDEDEYYYIENVVCVYDCVKEKRVVIKKCKRDNPHAIVAASATRFLLVYDRTIEEWDYASRKILKTLSAHSGLIIDGCEFASCRFTSPELAHTISQYGGMVTEGHITG